MRCLPSLLTLPLLVACASPSPAGPSRADTGNPAADDGVRPSLEEIFLEPPLFGVPPVLQDLSPDGSTLLLRWSPPTEPVRPGPDAENPRDPRPEVRLMEVADPDASGRRGTPLTEVLGGGPEGWSWCARCREASGGDAGGGAQHRARHAAVRPGATRFAHRGALLAVALGADLFLVDRAESPWRVRHAIAPTRDDAEGSDPASDQDEGETSEDEAESPSKSEAPTRLTGLTFSDDDGTLWLDAGDETYALPLDDDARWPVSLEDLSAPTRDLAGPAGDLQWDVAHRVAFANRDLLANEDSPAEDHEVAEREEGEERESEPAAPRQVVFLEDGHGVTLEGMADEPSLESARLSPDGRFVFAYAYDRSDEPEPTLIPDYLTERVTVRKARRLLADARPSPWRAILWDTATGAQCEALSTVSSEPETEDASTPESSDSDMRAEGTGAAAGASTRFVPRSWTFPIGWAPAGEQPHPARFALELRSEDFSTREIWLLEEGGARRVFRERDPHWIGGPAVYARWNRAGTALLLGSENAPGSTRPGWCQLFVLDARTATLTQLTEVHGEVRSFTPLEDGGVLVEASHEDAAQTAVFLLSPEAVRAARPELARQVPLPAGWNEGTRASRDGGVLVTSHESLFEPAELWATDGERARALTDTCPPLFHAVPWIRPERISVRSDDGRTIYAHVFLPPGVRLDRPGTPRATVVFVHGAGYLQNVTDSMTRYPLNLMFHSRLAALGYPVVDVDYRGSAGYGRDFRGDVQYHLGGKDLDDIQRVVDHLADAGLVDPERVGIYGGSYGGFMTMMALFTAPEHWAVGAALRSVTDWRTYHPWYTQPRLGRPSTHPEAYRRSSPIDLVDGLEDPLLVLHGLVDQNVFAQDSVRLIEKLIDRGKEFDAMLYPSQGHGFRDGPHWLDEYGRIERYLLGHLGPAVR